MSSYALDDFSEVGDLNDDALWEQRNLDGSAMPMLNAARKQAQTTLTAIRAEFRELKILTGTNMMTRAAADEIRLELNRRKARTAFFLQRVEARQTMGKQWAHANALEAVQRHRNRILTAGLKPNEFDEQLWSVLPADWK